MIKSRNSGTSSQPSRWRSVINITPNVNSPRPAAAGTEYTLWSSQSRKTLSRQRRGVGCGSMKMCPRTRNNIHRPFSNVATPHHNGGGAISLPLTTRELAPIHGINLGFQNFIGFLLVGDSLREPRRIRRIAEIGQSACERAIILVDSEKDGVIQSGIRDNA